MGLRTFNLPDPGEGLVEAEIVTWRVAVGDAVAVNDIVVEIETAKSLVELPIPWAGTVAELLVEQGTTVEVGAPIIRIEVEGTGDEPANAAAAGTGAAAPGTTPEPAKREPNLVGYGAIEGSSRRRARKPAAPAAAAAQEAPAAAAAPGAGGSGRGSDAVEPSREAASSRPPRPADSGPPGPSQQVDVAAAGAGSVVGAGTPSGSPNGPAAGSAAGTAGGTARPLAKPPVRKYAKDRGVDLAAVSPSAPTGIVSRADVDAFLAAGAAAGDAAGAAGAPETAAAGAGSAAYAWTSDDGEREVRIPVKGVRKVTAEAMVASAFSAPHVTEFVTVDVTATKELMARLAGDREFAGARVTELLFVAKALLIACRRNPGVNATWDAQAGEIVQKRYVNLGIAAATPRGLMVPNIKGADRLTLRELADALTGLVTTAREGRTQPADMAGGTITITNVGVFGVDTGTPIINPGESAILAMGAIRRQPWVVEAPDPAGGPGAVVERIEPRWVTQLALSFDHRLIDGDLGSRFLADVAAVLHDPTRGLVWG